MTFTIIGTWIVGAVFLGTGIVKALASQEFITQVFRYRLLSPLLVPFVAIAFIGLECAWGLGLILNEFPNYLIPGSIILIFCLSILTIWSTSTGPTEDCGCYGGLLVITPTQSVLLNLGYIALLGLAW